jgi:hypothetical protein
MRQLAECFSEKNVPGVISVDFKPDDVREAVRVCFKDDGAGSYIKLAELQVALCS